jgi:glyoxylate reductase
MLALRDSNWRGHPPPPLGHDPQGKVLGILGMGGIGRNLKKKAEVFGMTVIYHNRNKLSEELADGAEYVSFDDLLARSDVLSLNLPLNVSFLSFNIWAKVLDRWLTMLNRKIHGTRSLRRSSRR